MRHFSHWFSQVHGAMPGFEGGLRLPSLSPETWQPAVDIFELRDSLVLVVELPGVQKEEIHVRVEGGLLKISGFRPKQIPEMTRQVHQMEIPYGEFARYVQLPDHFDFERIEAEFADGFLRIAIPKRVAND